MRSGLALLGVLAAAGCASVLGIDSDRHYVAPVEESGALEEAGAMDAEEAAAQETGPTQPPGFACLNDPEPAKPSGNLTLRLVFTDVSGSSTSGSTGTPIAGAEVHACNKLDLTCSNPFGSVTTDDAGVAPLSVPGAFDGYYEMRAQSFTNSVLSRSPMLANETENQGVARISLLSQAGVLAGVTQDPTLTLGIVTVENCAAGVAAGVSIEVGSPGPNETVVYLVNNLPSQSATQTDDVSGTALIFNVPAGTLTVTASFADTHQVIRKVSTIARDNNWVTYVQIRPDQATVHP